MATLGELIYQLRTQRGQTHIDIVKIISRTLTMVREYEADIKIPDKIALQRLADNFGIDVAYLKNPIANIEDIGKKWEFLNTLTDADQELILQVAQRLLQK